MYHHQCHIIPGLLTVRSNYRWTLIKLLIAGVIVVIGFLVLKRFGSPVADPRATDYQHVGWERTQRPDNSQEPYQFERQAPQSAPPPQAFIPTRFRRKKLTKRQKLLVLQKYGHQCAMCHRSLDSFDTEFDHIRPLASDAYGERNDLNHMSNFRPLCRRCHGYVTQQQRKSGMFQRSRTHRSRRYTR